MLMYIEWQVRPSHPQQKSELLQLSRYARDVCLNGRRAYRYNGQYEQVLLQMPTQLNKIHPTD
jgi:hypothetical protein